jgi:hypothetical protein
MKHLNYALLALALSERGLVVSSVIREQNVKPDSYRGTWITHQTNNIYSFNTDRTYISAWFQSIKDSFLSILGFESDLPALTDFVQPPDQHRFQLSDGFSPCANSPTSRNCWGKYNTSTNYYLETPDTGRTVEIWLSAEESICNQDGYARPCLTFNGTMPGPAIIANWGDYLVVHVTNNLPSNGKIALLRDRHQRATHHR